MAVVNESATDKLIRELREENAKLLAQILPGKHSIDTTIAATGASNDGNSYNVSVVS